jgi:hypothetical protein
VEVWGELREGNLGFFWFFGKKNYKKKEIGM